MRTNVTRQFRSRERKCMGTKRPGTYENCCHCASLGSWLPSDGGLGLLTIESQIASASMCIVHVREGIARRVDLPNNNNNKNNDVPRSL